jgi:trk system potassium uptake protein TrkH
MISLTGLLMLIPAFIDYFFNIYSAQSFFISSIITIFVGFLCAFANKQANLGHMTMKEGLLLAVLSWVFVVAFASLPFYLSYLNMSYTDAYFEMMSGITTTGATIISNLDNLSYGLHLWRAIMQWIGGLGIIVIGIILFPSIQGGGMQLFKIEAFETFDSAFDRVKNIAIGMIVIYILITIVIILLLVFLANLGFFDAIIHAFTSVSTAGFSNKNSSVAYFDNPIAEVILIFSMIIGGIPYILLYYLVFLRKTQIFKDAQVKTYVLTIIILVVGLSLYVNLHNGINLLSALRYVSFSVVSLLTGTGLVNVDYTNFGYLPTMLLFFVMFIGGCGGSTACGIKIYRFQISYAILKAHLNKIFLHKHVSIPYYNGKIITNDMAVGIFVYLFLFLMILALSSVLLSMMNLDFITAFSASVTCLTNVGPGLGNLIGPSGNFANLPDQAKWVLSIVMLLGRLEIIGVIVLFNKNFWTN